MKRPCLLLALALVGCTGPTSRASFEVAAAAVALEEPAALALADGTAIELTVATFAFSDARFEAPSELARAPRLRPIPVAHAHPGHDFAGEASGELLGDFEVDLAAGEQSLGVATLLEGDYATARLSWPSDGPAVTLEGIVTSPERHDPLPFAFQVTDDREITGMELVAEVAPDAPPERLTLRLDLALMLSFSDWSTIDADGDGLLTHADGALGNTVPFGVRTSAAWSWEIE